jgi:hypothetical protein
MRHRGYQRAVVAVGHEILVIAHALSQARFSRQQVAGSIPAWRWAPPCSVRWYRREWRLAWRPLTRFASNGEGCTRQPRAGALRTSPISSARRLGVIATIIEDPVIIREGNPGSARRQTQDCAFPRIE